MAKQTFTTGQVLTAAQVNSLQTNDFNQTVNVKTASYVLVASDKGTRIEFNTSGSVTCTVNTGLFDAGDTLIIQNRGTGAVTVTAGTATVDTSATLVLSQYDSGTLYFISSGASIFFNSDAGGATPLTTKGDLYTFGTSDTRLAVGNNGETLVADSSASVGLRYQEPKAGNPIINSAFQVWQRGTSFTANSIYTADRWYKPNVNNITISRQTTGDTTNLPNIQYCARVQRDSGATGLSAVIISQSFETVNTIPFVGKTVTLSFYARKGANFSAASSAMVSSLYTGTGTDQNISVSYTGTATPLTQTNTLTTTWQRFSVTGTLATTATELGIEFYFVPVGTAGAADYFEITGVQLEVGSVATPFKTQGVTLAGELAACQRYYYAFASGSGKIIGIASYYTSNIAITTINLPVTMRTTPTLSHTTGTNYYTSYSNGSGDGFDSFTFNGSSTNTTVGLQGDTSTISGTAGYSGRFDTANASASIAFSAEL